MRSGGEVPSTARQEWDGRAFTSDRWQHRWEGGVRADWPGARALRLWLPVVLSFIAQVPFALVRAARPDMFDTDARSAAVGLALAVVGPAVLIGARAFPGPVVAVASAAASADLLLPGGSVGPPYVALAFAILSAAVRGARVWAWISVAAAWVITLVAGSLLGIPFRPFAIVGITLGILVVLGAGEGLRTRRERFAQYARATDARRQTAAQAERVRIARELHDVLAHSLSQINVQAGVGLHLMPTQPEKAAEALASIKQSSKSALDEVRAVLGVLRGDTESSVETPALTPEPDLSRLEALAASVRSASLSVELRMQVAVTPSAAVQLAVYRIVQEALTNVVRHSGAATARVTVTGEDAVIRVAVSDDGHGRSAASTDGGGLTGMRERAELFGGSLDARSTPTGFTVEASIPLAGERP